MLCPACRAEIAPGLSFCPACRARGAAAGSPPLTTPRLTTPPLATLPAGVPLAKPVAPPPPALPALAPPPPRTDRHERLFLVIACLLAAGALAIPRLMRSKAFGPLGKTVLGVLAALNTAAALALLGFIVLRGPELFVKYLHFIQNR